MLKNKKLIYYALGPILGGIFQLISIQFMSWFFDSLYVGMFSLIMVASYFSLIILTLGLDQSFAREFHANKNKTALLVHSIMPGILFLSLIGGSIFYLNPSIISFSLFEIYSTQISAFIFFTIIFEFFNRFLTLQMRMYEDAYMYALSQIFPRVAFLSLLIIFFAIFKFERNIFFLSLVYMLSVFSTLLFVLKESLIYFNKPLSSIDTNLLKKLFKFGAPLIFSGIAMWTINSFDKVVLRYTSQFDQLALVSIALTLSYIATFFSSVFNTIWAPLAYKWHSNNVNMKIIKLIASDVMFFMLLIILLCISFSWIFPFLFPAFYADIQFLFVAAVFGPFLYTLSEITGIGIALKRKTSFYILISTTSSIFGILSALYLIPLYGAKGAVLSVMTSYMSFFILRTYISMNYLLKINGNIFSISSIFIYITITAFLFFGELLPYYFFILVFIFTCFFSWLNSDKFINLFNVLRNKELFD
tara:strand:- start:1955 stop:3376 length:1422 start_codon:yes stop_codon:yes gene_type:complete